MPTLNEYFRTEARDFLNTLERNLERTPAPEADELHQAVRGLRGTAQMAREQRVFDVVSAFESVTRSIAGGALAWSDNIAARARETIADLRALLDGAEDEERLDERVRDAAGRWREADPDPVAVAEPPVLDPGTREFREFAAREAAGIADTLDHGITDLQSDPMDREPLTAILRRQRALLGSARLEEIPVIADILRAVEDLTRVIVKLDVGVKQEWLDIYRVARDALQTTIAPLLRDELPQSSNSVSRLRHMREELLERYGSTVDQPPPAEDPLSRTAAPVTAAPRPPAAPSAPASASHAPASRAPTSGPAASSGATGGAHAPGRAVPAAPFMGPARSTPAASASAPTASAAPTPAEPATAPAPPAAPAPALAPAPPSSAPPWSQAAAPTAPVAPPDAVAAERAGAEYEPEMLDLGEDAIVEEDAGTLELSEDSVITEDTMMPDAGDESFAPEDTTTFDAGDDIAAPEDGTLLDLTEEVATGSGSAMLDLGEDSVVEEEAAVLELGEDDIGEESGGAEVPAAGGQEALVRALELRDVIARAAAHDPRAREAVAELYDLIRSALG